MRLTTTTRFKGFLLCLGLSAIFLNNALSAVYQVYTGTGAEIVSSGGTPLTGTIVAGYFNEYDTDGNLVSPYNFSGKSIEQLFADFITVGSPFAFSSGIRPNSGAQSLLSNGGEIYEQIYVFVFAGTGLTPSTAEAYGVFTAPSYFSDVNDPNNPDTVLVLSNQLAGTTSVNGFGEITAQNKFTLVSNAAPTARFAFSSATASVDETGGSLAVTIQRSGVTTSAVSVQVSTTNGSALTGTDYTGITSPQTVNFVADDTEETVNIPITDRPGFQGSRQFSVLLGSPLPSGQAELGTIVTQTVTINDTEPAGITVSPTSGLTTTEAGGTAQFTVVLNRPPTGDVTIPLASNDTGEGTPGSSSLTFTPANWNTAQTVTVTGVDDDIDDGDVGYLIQLQAATSADAAYHGLDGIDVSVTNTDNDAAGANLPGAALVTSEAGGTAGFTLVLESEPTADVVIALSSTKPLEGVPTPSPLTFTPANWDTPQSVTVTGQDDFVADGTASYQIQFVVSSADLNYDGLAIPAVDATNTDNDSAGVLATPASGSVTSETGTTATVKVRLQSQPTANVVIPVQSNDTTEGTVSPTSLTFTPANWNVEQNLTLTGVNDPAVDGPQLWTITLGPPTGSDTTYTALAAVLVSATNNDDDSAGITVNPTGGLITTEAGATANFTVVLNTAPVADVTIGLSSNDTSEGTVSPNSLTFTSANWNTPQTVTVTGQDDSLADGAVAYTIVTAASTSADANYNGINPSDVAVTNQDNDTAGFAVSPTSGLITTEAGGQASFTVRLTSEPTANVTLPITSLDLTEGTASPSSLVFTPANWNTPQMVTLTGVDDFVRDGNIAYTIQTGDPTSSDSAYNGVGANPSDVSATNQDNDAIAVNVSPTGGLVTTEAGGQDSFTVVLGSEPTGTVVIPLSTGGSDPDEGAAGVASLTFNSGNWNVPQLVVVTGANDFLVDGPRSYSVVTGAITGTDASGYVGVNPSDVTVNNTDNDIAGFTLANTSGKITSEATGPQKTTTFTVVLTAQPSANVGLVVASSDPTEGTAAPANLTFTNANWNTPQTVTITGADDFLDDGDLPYTVTVGPATSSDMAFNGLSQQTVSVVNLDNDELALARLGSNAFTVSEGSSVTIPITMSGHPGAGASIPVAYRTLNGSAAAGRDYETRTGTVNFTANGTQNITIPTINDTDPENDEAFFFELLPPGSGALYGLASPALATIVITRNSEGLDQPDLLVGFDAGGSTQFSGANIYNTTGDSQIAFRQNASRGSKQTYRVRVQNDGPVQDSLVITGVKSFTRIVDFKVQTLTESQANTTITVTRGGKNVTSQVFGSGLVLTNTRGGQSTDLLVTISTSSSTPTGTNIGVTLTGTSSNTSSKKDAARCLMGIQP